MITAQQILSAKILIVDDQKLDVVVLEKILKTAGYSHIHVTNDSRRAAGLYREIHPDLVLLDLNMPYMDGFQVLEQLNSIENESFLSVLVLSAEQGRDVRLKALKAGAKDFLNKPYESVEVLMRIHNMIEVRMLHDEVRDQNKILELKIKERTHELRDTRLDIIQRLARAAEYRDNETGMHVFRMSHYCALLASKIGMSESQCELVLTASPLHDIGKIGIPDFILLKPGKLDGQEWEIMKTHTTIGAELLSGSSSPLMMMAEVIALSHHEKWDGSGYPRGLKGEDIPLVGRIAGLCDVFDALTSKRPYKAAWTVEATVAEIKKSIGGHFDPRLAEIFIHALPDVVRLKEQYNEPESPSI